MSELTTVPVLFWALTLIILLFAALIVWKIFTNAIDLSNLLSESGDGKASLSRFQFLMFTFVIAGLYLSLCIKSSTFVDVPNGVLALLGISAGGYVIGKGISGKPGGVPAAEGEVQPAAEARKKD